MSVTFFGATRWAKKKSKVGNKHGTKFVNTLRDLRPSFGPVGGDQP